MAISRGGNGQFEGRKWPEGRAETASFGGENGHFRSNSSDGGGAKLGGQPPAARFMAVRRTVDFKPSEWRKREAEG